MKSCFRKTCQLVRHAIHTHVGSQVRDHGRKAAAARLLHVPRSRLFIREVCPFLQHYRLTPPFIRTGAECPVSGTSEPTARPTAQASIPHQSLLGAGTLQIATDGVLGEVELHNCIPVACFLPMT